ncbi:SDR family oxidoreductase [Halopseudomonas sp. SMJS2]|uniref:SDR family NAD(P)-dependent oxidoreductase n=1 Tax=Halopseudomonas sp. SMJS2 TaxID=3041098 RepID=UPI0024536DE8|nr:glucose 1-dehydrogenase [Halopseudomonas sp. SMJS2]WGK62465.1 SDR family oxidoreductase [Halopseudomonas sp. SMJS2]
MFTSKRVVITGAASGIGLATALAFARQGARLFLVDIDQVQLDAAATEARKHTADVHVFRCDLTSPEQVGQLKEELLSRMEGMDILFNNAGIGASGALTADIEEDEFTSVMAVNVVAVWRMMKLAISLMLEQGGGVIINTASALSITVMPGSAAYNASKHAVAALTKTATTEYAQQNIRINAICPGVIRTALLAARPDIKELEPQLLALHPIGRLGNVEEVAEAVVWLASDKASFVHGALFTVDGGWTAS